MDKKQREAQLNGELHHASRLTAATKYALAWEFFLAELIPIAGTTLAEKYKRLFSALYIQIVSAVLYAVNQRHQPMGNFLKESENYG